MVVHRLIAGSSPAYIILFNKHKSTHAKRGVKGCKWDTVVNIYQYTAQNTQMSKAKIIEY